MEAGMLHKMQFWENFRIYCGVETRIGNLVTEAIDLLAFIQRQA